MAIDDDVYAIGANSQVSGAQIVNVLTAINSKVRAGIGGALQIRRFTGHLLYRSIYSDRGWRQVAGRYTVQC